VSKPGDSPISSPMGREEPLRALWTADGIILPSGRLCAGLREIDEPCIVEWVRQTGELVTVTITRADCEDQIAAFRRQSLPHTCTRWCAPPDHVELHTYGPGTPVSAVKTTEQRDARALGRTVDRIVPVQTTDRTPTVVALVFFHGGEL
jgi:hypothetical protein